MYRNLFSNDFIKVLNSQDFTSEINSPPKLQFTECFCILFLKESKYNDDSYEELELMFSELSGEVSGVIFAVCTDENVIEQFSKLNKNNPLFFDKTPRIVFYKNGEPTDIHDGKYLGDHKTMYTKEDILHFSLRCNNEF